MYVAESTVENKTVTAAKLAGWEHYKFVSPGRRGVPDHFFAKYPNKVIFIEFKRVGEVSSLQQKKQQSILRAIGFEVYEVWSVEQGVAIFSPL